MKKESLHNGFYVYTDGFDTFSQDSLLLAEFAGKAQNALDLCSGCGIIPILLIKQGTERVTAVEINGNAAELIRLSAKQSNVNVTVLEEDVRGLELAEGFDLITANPPYFKQSRSPVLRRNEIRSELLLKPRELFETAKKHLSESGEFCFCHVCLRLSELTEELNRVGLYIHRLTKVRSTAEKEPYLFLAACKKHPCEQIQTDTVVVKE